MYVVDVKEMQPDGMNIGFIFTRIDQAEFPADVDDSRVMFSTTNPGATAYRIIQLPHVMLLKAEAILCVLHSVTCWNWHLRCIDAKIHLFSKMVNL